MTSKVHSIELLWQSGVPKTYIRAAENALRRAISCLGIADRLHVTVGGAHADITSILKTARQTAKSINRPGQAYADDLVRWLSKPSWHPAGWRGIGMLIVNDDLGCRGDDFIFGSANGAGATVSTFRYRRDTRIGDPIGLFETLVMHELGHAIGAANPDRGSAIQEWFGPHCTNPCVMRQRDDLPEFEADVLPVLKTEEPYCRQCRKDVAVHFARRVRT